MSLLSICLPLHTFSQTLTHLALPLPQQHVIDQEIQSIQEQILQQAFATPSLQQLSLAPEHLETLAAAVKQLLATQNDPLVVQKIEEAFDQLLLHYLPSGDPYRLDLAKQALARNPATFSAAIGAYQLTPEQRLALAVHEQKNYPENFLAHLAAYQLTPAWHLELAKNTLAWDLEKFIPTLPHYTLNVQQCIELTKLRLRATAKADLLSTYRQLEHSYNLNAHDLFALRLNLLPAVINQVKPADMRTSLQAVGFYDQTPAQRWQLVQTFQKDFFSLFITNITAYDIPEAQRFELLYTLQTQYPLKILAPYIKLYALPEIRRFKLAQLAQKKDAAVLIGKLQAYELSAHYRLQLAKSLAKTNSETLATCFSAYNLSLQQGFELALEVAAHSTISLKPFIEAYDLNAQQCAQLTACAVQRGRQAAQQPFEYAKTALLRHTEGTFAHIIQRYALTPLQRFELAKLAILHEDLATFSSHLAAYAFEPEQHFALLQIAHAHLDVQTLAPYVKDYACTENQRLQLAQTALQTLFTKYAEDEDIFYSHLKKISAHLIAYDLPQHHWMLAQLILNQNARACLANLSQYTLTVEQRLMLLKQAAAINAQAVANDLKNYDITPTQAFELAKIATAENPKVGLKFIQKYTFDAAQRLELAQIAVLNARTDFTNQLPDYQLTAAEVATLTQTSKAVQKVHAYDPLYTYNSLANQLEAAPTLPQRLEILAAMPKLTWMEACQLLRSCPPTSGLAVLEHLKKQAVIFPPRQITQLLINYYQSYANKPSKAAVQEEFLLALTAFAIQQGANINASNGRGIGSSKHPIYPLVFAISLATLKQLVAKGIEFHHSTYDYADNKVNLAQLFISQFFLRDFAPADFYAKAALLLQTPAKSDPLFRQTAIKFQNKQILDMLDCTALTEQDKIELWKLAFQRENSDFWQALKAKIELPIATDKQMQVWRAALIVGSPAILEWLKRQMLPLADEQIDDLFEQALTLGSVDIALRIGQWQGNAEAEVLNRIATWVIAKNTAFGSAAATWSDANAQSIVGTLDWLALSSSLTTGITPLSRLIEQRSSPSSAAYLQAAAEKRSQWAMLIARYRSTNDHHRQIHLYHLSVESYAQQQREFGQAAFDLASWEIELLRKDPTRSAKAIFKDLAQWRYEIAARRNDEKLELYRSFRDQPQGNSVQTPIENKELDKTLPYELTLPLFEKNYQAALKQSVPGIQLVSEPGYQITYTPRDAKSAIGMTIITPSKGAWTWLHAKPQVLEQLWQELETTHTDIINYPLDKNDAASVAGLEKLVLQGVALSAHIRATDRGNSQYTRVLLNIWCGYKGLPQRVPSLDYPLLDTIALMLTVEQFSNMPFKAFFEPSAIDQ